MDVTEQKYRKIINLYRQPLNNLVSQYPINQQDLPNIRNLKYIVQKQSITMNLPYDDDQYESIFDDIKQQLTNQQIQIRIYAIRLSRSLPFSYRIRVIQQCQNDIIKLVTSAQNSKSDSPTKNQTNQNSILLKKSNYQFSYQVLSDTVDLLLSVYQLTHFSQQIYFDVNQRIVSIFSRIIETGYNSDNLQLLRNCYETIRSIFILFGPNNNKNYQYNKNKLINKLIGYFNPSNIFMAKGINNSNTINNQIITQKGYSNKFYHLILKTKYFQSRIRSRFFYGLCCLLSFINQNNQINDLLIKQIFIVLENANQCDINIQCFNAIKAILKSNCQFYTRNSLIKKWATILTQIPYKKQYLQFFICLLTESSLPQNKCPLRVKFNIGITFLQITKNVSQQFSRFIIYKLACKNIMNVSTQISSKQKNQEDKMMILLNIYFYDWFLDRQKQQNDLFRYQFLICLLQSYFTVTQNCSKTQILDLIKLCHRLLDWKCSNKDNTYLPTIKFAFDMYIAFLKKAHDVLGQQFQIILVELIQKCNGAQSVYFLFKLKLLSVLVSLTEYQKCWKRLQSQSKCKIKFNQLNQQIIFSIMPKNPKPIFNFPYSQSADGIIQSRKQIQIVKVIMQLLGNLQKSHQELNQMVQNILIRYHTFLNNLQNQDSNKDLIYCLQTGTADQYFSVCQRNFLLSLIDQIDAKGNNFQLNLDNNILYSPYETFQSQDQINIFGPMSPVQLTVKFHLHNSYSSIYIQVKKNNWVSCPKLKLIISSGMQKKQLLFQSSITEIKIDRIGGLHFQVWTADTNELLIGSGNLKIRRKLIWRKINYLGFIDGIKRKSYFKKNQNFSQNESQCYLSYYYGQPLLVQIFRNCNQVLFGVSNKQVWSELQTCLPEIIQEFTNGTAIIFQ